jgi:hypothetical protein
VKVNVLCAIGIIIAFLLSCGKDFRHDIGEFKHDFVKIPVPVVPFEMSGSEIVQPEENYCFLKVSN